MLFEKKKYSIEINSGSGQFNTVKLRGILYHLIVQPSKKDTAWTLKLIDKDGDEIYDKSHVGRLDDKSGLALGTDTNTILTVLFSGLNQKDKIKVIFIVKELE